MRHAISLPVAMFFTTLLGCSSLTEPQQNAQQLSPADNSHSSLDWQGIYVGTTPCADCAGIRTRIELRSDGTYSRSLVYLGKGGPPVADTGRFDWENSGSRITVGTDRNVQKYLVGENALFHLDRAGSRIVGDHAAAYRLEKVVKDPNVENRRWTLVELNGRPVETPTDREGPYLEFQGAESRVAGRAFCNRFFGSYELTAGGRIRFNTDMGMSMMACPDLEREREFLDALGKADNYTLGEGTLSLNRARMAPLARFRESVGGNPATR